MNTFVHLVSSGATSMFWLRSRSHNTLALTASRTMRALQDSDVWLVDANVNQGVVDLAPPSARVIQLEPQDNESRGQTVALGQMRRYRRAGYSVARLRTPSVAGDGALDPAALRLPLMPSQVTRGVTLVAPRADEPSPDWVRLSHNGMTLVCYMGGFSVVRLSQDLTRMGCSAALRVTAVYYKACAQYRYEHTTLKSLVQAVASGQAIKPAVVVLDGMMPL
ncbi:MAG: hypothetical protein CML16_16535 [Pusillimonas sp.]|nr:hypothetical protein [Pusillimonas sp.]MBC42145.1 hypothetical protein [Pusillimonas sp.]HCP77222.1 hypothetical protein [Pusillimonas sp.]|tara:strand:+ start:11542 stop:12204 length:663 start_codon:yes stop_codon:yes gene_type:complete